MRSAVFLFVVAAIATGCDSGSGPGGPADLATGPSGRFAIEPVWFELHVVEDEGQGFYADYQGWIEGSLALAESGGALSGQGTCTWTRRLHRSWLGETSRQSETQGFTATGSIDGGGVTLDLQGCAWVMVRHTGTFADGTYSLRIPDVLSGPLYPPDVWDGAVPLNGSDPFALVLTRE